MLKLLVTKVRLCWLGLCFFVSTVQAQDQKIADSLVKIYQTAVLNDTSKMSILKLLAFNEVRDLNLAYQYAGELVKLAEEKNNPLYLARGYTLQGNIRKMMGDVEESLDAYFKAVAKAVSIRDQSAEGAAYSGIADVYSLTGNTANALQYRTKAIIATRAAGDSIPLAGALTNAGAEYNDNGKPDSALIFFRESAQIYDRLKHEVGKAYSLGNIGMAYAALGKTEQAEKNLNEAIRLLEVKGLYDPICSYLLAMSDIYFDRDDLITSIREAKRSLEQARLHRLKNQISESNLQLSKLLKASGNPDEALTYYQQHILYRDSVNNVAAVQKMADLRTNFEVSRKQVEVDLLNAQKRNQRNILISLSVIIGLGIILLGSLFWYNRVIAREKQRSENLLLNILPAAVAKELKDKGSVDAVKFDSVTVLFTDFVQFTRVAEKVDPEQLVKSIDFYFRGFDQIAVRHGLEKIKTVGDSYMCAGGLPEPGTDHAARIIRAAQEMIALVRSQPKVHSELSHFEVRIGIHTGPVVAGIVGTKKWQYDIWGDTVNVASRMESNSHPGRINLSAATWEAVKEEFDCEYRGEIEVKGRGPMKMYFVADPLSQD